MVIMPSILTLLLRPNERQLMVDSKIILKMTGSRQMAERKSDNIFQCRSRRILKLA